MHRATLRRPPLPLFPSFLPRGQKFRGSDQPPNQALSLAKTIIIALVFLSPKSPYGSERRQKRKLNEKVIGHNGRRAGGESVYFPLYSLMPSTSTDLRKEHRVEVTQFRYSAPKALSTWERAVSTLVSRGYLQSVALNPWHLEQHFVRFDDGKRFRWPIQQQMMRMVLVEPIPAEESGIRRENKMKHPHQQGRK
ncbi:MAG: hypothetical protein BJ554DRAFT_4287 [Olpidium bornovanus]|uniref:Uncharacterized protein n=1 Tax=Olpidium bornovanus TaxID=278681 RepID=A0A8H7ZMF7_9FUNG|nr:MAG: hypothetical protein BJ554DRAFT_4287 [Olpidium bornovanus]